ncbi:MAG TPA: copper resistance CopC family protein [Dactylosporangium sp.]|nr:copper resistance CopC family protein [Dactylosporangium sp.]
MLPQLLAALALTAPVPSIVDSMPGDGAALSAPPAAVELLGSRPIDAGASHVGVRDAQGRAVPADPPAADGSRLRAAVRLPGRGDYTVAYHVVFAGGGEAIGSFGFSVGTAVRPPRAAPAPPSHAGHEHGVDPFGASLLLLDAAVLLGAALLLLRRPAAMRRHRVDEESRS